MKRVFISYSSQDATRAEELVTQLELLAIPCWIAPRDVAAGSDYASEIVHAIQGAAALVFLHSADSNTSKHCLRELEIAVTQSLPIIPAKLDDSPMGDGIQYRLSTLQWVDLRPPRSLRAIVQELAAALAQLRDPISDGSPDLGPEPAEVPVPSASIPLDDERVLIAGRDAELRLLGAELDAVGSTGQGRFVLLGGESGVGKSALVSQLSARASAAGFRIVSATCGSFLNGVSFFAANELLRQLSGSSDVLATIKGIYGANSHHASMAAVVDSVLAEPSAKREAMLATFANVVFGIAGQPSPLLLIVDDMEYVDPGSVDSLLCILARISDGPVLVVGIYRSDVADLAGRSHPIAPLLEMATRAAAHCTSLRVHPLRREAYPAVLEAMLGGPVQLPSRLIDHLWRETEGNALFLREIIRAIGASADGTGSNSAHLVDVDGRWRFVGNIDTLETPRSVEEAITRNLTIVGDEERGYLEIASVIGKQFGFDLAVGLSGASDDELLDSLERCVSQSILRELVTPVDSFEFSHNKVRDVLYNSLSRIRRKRIHSRIADLLVATEDGSPERESLIGEHLFRAERTAEAAPFLLNAGKRLMAVMESSRAVIQLDRVLQCIEGGGVTGIDPIATKLLRIKAVAAANDYAHGIDLCTSLIEETADLPEERGWAWDSLGDLLWATGDSDGSLRAYESAEALIAAAQSPRLELEVCADLAEFHNRAFERRSGIDDAAAQEHASRADQYLMRQYELAQTSDDSFARARAFRNYAKKLRSQGDLAQALELYELSLAQTDPRVASHQVLVSYAKALRFAGRRADAISVISRVLDWSIQTGARRSMGIALHYRAMLSMDDDGATDSARSDLDHALALHEEIGYDRGLWEVHVLRGEWFAMRGDWQNALRDLAEGLALPDAEPSALIESVCSQLRAIDERARAERLADEWRRSNE